MHIICLKLMNIGKHSLCLWQMIVNYFKLVEEKFQEKNESDCTPPDTFLN